MAYISRPIWLVTSLLSYDRFVLLEFFVADLGVHLPVWLVSDLVGNHQRGGGSRSRFGVRRPLLVFPI